MVNKLYSVYTSYQKVPNVYLPKYERFKGGVGNIFRDLCENWFYITIC